MKTCRTKMKPIRKMKNLLKILKPINQAKLQVEKSITASQKKILVAHLRTNIINDYQKNK